MELMTLVDSLYCTNGLPSNQPYEPERAKQDIRSILKVPGYAEAETLTNLLKNVWWTGILITWLNAVVAFDPAITVADTYTVDF